MKFFRYTAKDSVGQLLQGTVQASDEQAVRRDLDSRGFQVQQIESLGSPQASRTSLPPLARTTSNPVPAPTPTSIPTSVRHTKAGTDKQRFFLFSQLSSALRAGMNPASAFAEIAQRSAAQFEESLRYASTATTQGKAISEVFATYPDLYPKHVVGITRAGEAAGFLPDAFDEIARQAESAHSFKRWFFWVWFVGVNFLLSVPVMKVTTTAVMSDWNRLNATGGGGGGPMPLGEGASLFFREMLSAFIWPWGPITLACYGGLVLLNRWMASAHSLMFRHRLGLRVPVYGKRAWQENLARFSWTMSHVSRAGISPARSWQLSADSVPNLAFNQELLKIGGQLAGHEKMSDIFFRSKLFPEEYGPMIASAEYTGDLSGALDKLSQISAGEYVAAQNYAKARSGCWGLLAIFITSALLVGMLLKTVSVDIPQQIMKETDEGP